MLETICFQAHPGDHGVRLDCFLDKKLEESRSVIQRWIKREAVTLNGRICKSSRRLKAGDNVRVIPLPSPSLHIVPENLPLSIVFEDEELLVVNKSAGTVVHPGAGNGSGTLVNALLFYFEGLSRKRTVRPGIVHRLDKGTSGLLVVAKNDFSHDNLALQFKERRVTKVYLSLVYGRVNDNSGRIDLPVGRHPSRRIQMSTRSHHPRSALTKYQVINRFKGFSYLEVSPHTGRTHQIRVHLEHLGHPIVGDPIYRGNRRNEQSEPLSNHLIEELNHQFLHAFLLKLNHPKTGQTLIFKSILPDNLNAILKTLKK